MTRCCFAASISEMVIRSSAGSDTLYDIEENSIRDDDSLSGGSDGHHYMDYARFGDDYDGEFKLAHFLKDISRNV
ncbi:hypothetical protein QJS04_geneDACA006412 [Acorus gramineus]|uniref:Uncharacterized protein n=1 Tax=Acorus gramineus TaxID=55184 RepID=A0AAV9AW58_ACOGR|nr:hypothetical protein QJS04_geneDACA006412 [Acorus gramineus]